MMFEVESSMGCSGFVEGQLADSRRLGAKGSNGKTRRKKQEVEADVR